MAAVMASYPPACPMDYEAVADKFRECAEFARFPSNQAEAIVKQVTNLDGLGHVRELTDLLVR
jgi:hypothetical protein